jgi:ABC-type multidrug transport system fused ATPase/permease subunit
VLAYDYPLLDVFWTMLEFFLLFVWIWLLIIVFSDIFRSRDLGGFAKALWVLFVIVIPLFGVLIYLIVRGGKMHERAAERARQQDESFRAYVQESAGTQTGADEVAMLANLKASGVISEEEFQAAKAKALGGG